jgi:Kef-type K+ transport system membrane component KefB
MGISGGIIVPFGMGVGLGFLLPGTFLASPDQRVVFALFVGTALGLSAIPVIAKVLMEMNLVWRDIGQLTLGAGMVDDVTGWILLGVVTGLARSGEVNMLVGAQAIGAVLLVLAVSLTVGRRLVSGGLRLVDNHIGGEQAKIRFVMVLAVFLAAGTHLLHPEAALGAFVAGVLVGRVKRFDASTRPHVREHDVGRVRPGLVRRGGPARAPDQRPAGRRAALRGARHGGRHQPGSSSAPSWVRSSTASAGGRPCRSAPA